MRMSKTKQGAESVEWFTPQYVLDYVQHIMPNHNIDIDPCWSPKSHVNATICYGKEDDGLTKDWIGNVFMNPPYGKPIPYWIVKFLDEYSEGNIRNGIMLIPLKMETNWFRAIANRCKFMDVFNHRIKFDTSEGNSGQTGWFASALVYFGEDFSESMPILPCCYRILFSERVLPKFHNKEM